MFHVMKCRIHCESLWCCLWKEEYYTATYPMAPVGGTTVAHVEAKHSLTHKTSSSSGAIDDDDVSDTLDLLNSLSPCLHPCSSSAIRKPRALQYHERGFQHTVFHTIMSDRGTNLMIFLPKAIP